MSVTDKVDLVSLIGFLALLASAAALTPARAVWCLHRAMPANVLVIEVFVSTSCSKEVEASTRRPAPCLSRAHVAMELRSMRRRRRRCAQRDLHRWTRGRGFGRQR